MAIRKSASSGIPFGNNAGRPANPSIGQLYSNGESSRLELYTNSGWQNIVAETPSVISFTGEVYEAAESSLVIAGTNFTSGALVFLVGSDNVEIECLTATVASAVQITATFDPVDPANEPYDIKVLNTSNLYGVLSESVYVNDTPTWAAASGSLGTVGSNTSVSISAGATDEENATLTYAIASGSLPSGLSLNTSTGLISGIAPIVTSNTTYNFTVSVSDGDNSTTRAYSITVNSATVSGGTLVTSDSTYYYRTFNSNGSLIVANGSVDMEILTLSGGGGGGRPYAGAGGAGGLKSTSQKMTSQTYAVTVGAGGAGGSGDGSYARGGNGVNSSVIGGSISISTTGGGGGSSYGDGSDASINTYIPANGGSGGGGGGDQPVQRKGSGISGEGFDGGLGSVLNSGLYRGGGGGGSGGAGVDGGSSSSQTTGGTGGTGTNAYSSWLTAVTSSMSGVSGWSTATSTGRIGGGGGGGIYNATGNPAGAGGAGGGGAGGRPLTANDGNNGSSGITNTGSGGGGAGGIGNGPNGGGNGGSGSSGLVLVRYLKTSVGS